jgi:tetratricopeptide (TPR) repeat protein
VKPLPEIDPEIRGLLEELVSDPRASIRLVPKRALRPWLESSDTASSRDVSENRLARHLVEAHREALARLLLEASRIAYWKSPVLSHFPTGKNGELYDVLAEEGSWLERSRRKAERSAPMDEGVELLRQCLEGIDPKRGYDLARGSLSLVAADEASMALAFHMKEEQPRSSLSIMERVARGTPCARMRELAWSGAASRRCRLKVFDSAIEAYDLVRENWPEAWAYIFNLATVQGRTVRALEAAKAIEQSRIPSASLGATAHNIREWAASMTPAELDKARLTLRNLKASLPEMERIYG